MAYDEIAKKATLKYRKKNIKQIILDLNRTTDTDIIDRLESVPNRSQYLKELIRNDLKMYNNNDD